MPRRALLTAAERRALLAFPTDPDALIRHYTFDERDLTRIRRHRGGHNRLGFAVHLCCLRFPGYALPADATPPEDVVAWVARQLQIDPAVWSRYARRPATRWEHLQELYAWLSLTPFGVRQFRSSVQQLTALAMQTDRGLALATALVEQLRQQRVLLPPLDVLDRVCAVARTRGTRRVYAALTTPLTVSHHAALAQLLEPHAESTLSTLAWLRQPPGVPTARHALQHLERLRVLQTLDLPDRLEQAVHHNRLLKLAREGAAMTAQHLRDLEPQRRTATLVAVALETRATITDELIDLHDRFMGTLLSRAKQSFAEQVQDTRLTVGDKLRLFTAVGRALVAARKASQDPFAAIEAVVPWEVFAASVGDLAALAQPDQVDVLAHLSDGYTQLRRYTPLFLDTLTFKAAPAARAVLSGVETLTALNASQVRKLPADAPTAFVRKRWRELVCTPQGLDRRFYELCVLTELKNALRSGDLWVEGSRQFKAFDDYLLPAERIAALLAQQALPLAVNADGDAFLRERLALLERELATVNRLAAAAALPQAALTERGLRITPLDKAVPAAADALQDQIAALLPRVKITDLLLEVDDWTGFTRPFTHLKSGEPAPDRTALLTAILADAINLGLVKMAEACPDTSYARLAWLHDWYLRDDTYTAALAELTNAQAQAPFAAHWGMGTTSSSDGQRFWAGGAGEGLAHHNAKYGREPGVTFYTHIADQYAPYHVTVIHAPVRDSTYVLDGLLYHESELRIAEHYTDTSGFTDHVFALMQLLGFRFAPRIRDLKDKKLYVPGDAKALPALTPLIGGSLNLPAIRTQWTEILRLATSIQQGTVTASLMLRKLGSYPRQNGLAVALRELGRIERTLFTLEWLQSVELRRRVHAGLNKGEAKNALARAVFFNRLGEVRDRSYEHQRYRASGLNLVIAAIILWNTVYLERAVQALRAHGQIIDEALLPHLAPLGWEHINLTGDYSWRQRGVVPPGTYRPLRPVADVRIKRPA
jgi:TnpA family transposase